MCGHYETIPGAIREAKATWIYDIHNNIDFAVGNFLAKPWHDTGGDLEKTLLAYNGGGDPDYVDNVMEYYKMLVP